MTRKWVRDTEELTEIDKTRVKDVHTLSTAKPEDLSLGFTIIHGSEVDFGKHFHFSKNDVIIGRDLSCHIPLTDEKVSKKHCEVSIIRNPDFEQIMIRDLHSTNGTYVNGEPVTQMVLKASDKITIGDTVIRISYNDELEEEYCERLFRFAATDALTGLSNRRYIINELENQSKIAKRNNRQFCIIIIDIDNFKMINDAYGHLAGDDYLKKFALVITQSLREQDFCGRIGGEEFIIILPETKLEGGLHLANRIRERVAATEVRYQEHILKTTMSGGISQFGLHADDRRTLFKLADMGLQEAKTTGKNKIVCLSPS